MRLLSCAALAVVLVHASVVCGQTLQFTDVTAQAGLNAPFAFAMTGVPPDMLSMPAGGAVGDFNRDGWPDVFVLCGGHRPDALFINNGDGTFTDQAASWGVAVAHLGVGAAVGDYNHDGWPDIYVTSFGDPNSTGAPGQHKLYRNNGDGTFTDVAAAAGVAWTSLSMPDGWSAAWGDYDHDGDLDLAVAGWMNGSGGNKLFRNNGDGTFTDVTSVLNFDMTPVRGFAPRFCDMDGDLWPELLWVADFETSKYFINNRDGTFTEYTQPAGVGLDTNGMGQTVGDFDNDGRIDWYVTSIWRSPTIGGNMLYMNQGNHSYQELSRTAGVNDGGWGWGTVAVDLNHDGWLDIVETNGWWSGHVGEMNRVFLNNADGTFSEVAASVGMTFTGQGRGLVSLDYDRDGDMDILVFANDGNLALYRNDLSGPDTHWLEVRLDTSQRSDLPPDGIGARIEVTAGGLKQVRLIDGGSNYLSNSEPIAHFGLGASTTVQHVRVFWPDGTVTQRTRVPADRRITLRPLGRQTPRRVVFP